MKVLSGAIVIFITISCICIYADSHLDKIVQELNQYVEEIEDEIFNQKFPEAKYDFIRLKNLWEEKEKFIQLQTEHSELDIINEQITVISSHLDYNEYDEFYETIYKLKYFINHITDKKKLNLKTIL